MLTNDTQIRAALPSDEASLLQLAAHLDSVNLPNDRSAIRRLLRLSEQSFSGEQPASCDSRYLFILELGGKVVGTSCIVRQLGSHEAPYIYFDTIPEERYSRDLNLHFQHTILRLGFSYDGPTELAGLVVDPAHRRTKTKPGLCISYARFLYIAARRALFQDELLAELLPPLEADGTSHLWDALGRRFTQMSYRDADRLSHDNKDFIRDLFPRGVIHASLLSPEAQAVIGEVGQQTKGVERMLRRIGFRYADRVDPFDGGPHFTCKTDDVAPIRDFKQRSLRVDEQVIKGIEGAPKKSQLLGTVRKRPPYFLATPLFSAQEDDAEELVAPPSIFEALQLNDGDPVFTIPMP